MELEGQLTFDDNPIKVKFNEGLSTIQKGNLQDALKIMEEIFDKNPNFTGVVETIKAIKYWQNRWVHVLQLKEGFERAKYLLKEWENFNIFIENSRVNYLETVVYFKNLIFKKILKNLIFTYQQSEIPNIDILMKIGEIFLYIEEYQKAIESFEYAKLFKKKDSYQLSLLAEAYNRINNDKMAKLLFREAFLYNPEKIDLAKIKTGFIHEIIDFIKANNNYPMEIIMQWIPIYGCLLNYFNYKRELKEEDIVKLSNEVEDLEGQYHSKHISDDFIVPRLLNRLIWLLDYYYLQYNNDEYIKIYSEKLKNIDTEIFEKYNSLINNKINVEKVEKYEY